MKGNVVRKISEKGYGFIAGEDKVDYFFHMSDLKNTRWTEITEGDSVEFENILKNGNHVAISVKKDYGEIIKRDNTTEKKETVYPGKHPMICLDSFSDHEKRIVNTLSKTFYVTNGGGKIELGSTSVYRYCLIKPTSNFEIQFNLKREITVIFSPFEHFEPRTFDAISEVYKKNTQQFRIDKMCSVVISKDANAVEEISRILKSDIEMQVVIPFSYDELMEGDRTELIVNRFREFFFERDLFAFESPLMKDIYFFGRRDYVHELISRHSSGENSGVFGLRRSGKTSVLQAVKRASALIGTSCIFIDCQEIYHYRWYKALRFVVKRIADEIEVSVDLSEEAFTEENASASFVGALEVFFQSTQDIILMFDEVEQITPGLSLSDAWKTGDDFIVFWHSLRSSFHTWGKRFTFILAGTNPSAVEMITINKHDNPLFNQLKADSYLPPFDVGDTSDMVNKLGGYMGISFDDIVCANLTQDFGGHPYLIRHFCSSINMYLNENRMKKPLKVTNALYQKVMPIFVEKYADNFCRFILGVLVDYYPEENKFLERLALGDVKDSECGQTDPQLLSHLMGYNIIENNNGILGYKIDVLKQYLIRKYSYRKQNMSNEEKWAEISERRNRVEVKLRLLVKNQLKSAYGESQARQQILNSMKPELRPRYSSLSLNDLMDPQKCQIYFKQLGTVIDNCWERSFKNVLSHNKPSIRSYFTIVNDLREDCHAKEVTDDEMNSFRGAISVLEKEVSDYFGE